MAHGRREHVERRQGCPKKLPPHLTGEADGKAATGREPMRDMKEAGDQNRLLSDSEPSVGLPRAREVPTTTEARLSPRKPWTLEGMWAM